MGLEVNITARAETENGLTAAMRKAVDQCRLGWNKGRGEAEDGSASYEFSMPAYPDASCVVENFSIKALT